MTVQFYISKRKELTEHYASCSEDIGLLRWELHSKFSEANDLLPPTPAALKFHIMRANFVTLLWKVLMRCLSPVQPNMIGNGWHNDLTPVKSDELPAPEFSLELTVCGCKKTHCGNNRCSCFKFQLKCTDACHCLDCQNEQLPVLKRSVWKFSMILNFYILFRLNLMTSALLCNCFIVFG